MKQGVVDFRVPSHRERQLACVQHLLAQGADPNYRDTAYHRTALDWCRQHTPGTSAQHTQIETILRPLTRNEC